MDTTKFLSTPSARRATLSHVRQDLPRSNFYPRPPRGGRRGIPDNHATLLYFYPRPPRGGRPQQRAAAAAMVGFLSTPSARRATFCAASASGATAISIHALREEGDAMSGTALPTSNSFLSTPSARRATCCPLRWASIPGNFYPRPPRGGRQSISGQTYSMRAISIHALREEGDLRVIKSP